MALAPPTPQILNSHENRGPPLFAFNVAMSIVAIIALSLRFCSRLCCQPVNKRNTKLWWDDWLALAAMPFLLASAVLACITIRFGFGRHVWDVPAQNLLTIAKIMFFNCLVYDATLTFAKASVLMFYSRVFQPRTGSTWFKMGLHATHALNIAWWIGAGLAKILMCDPTPKFWDPSIPGKCGSLATMWLSTGIAGIVIDFIILVLPLPIIWNLSMSHGRKLALTGVFVCGYSVIIISIGRLVTIVSMINSLATDVTFIGIPLAYWLSAELPVTMISISLPAMSQVARRISSSLNPLYSKAKAVLSPNSSLSEDTPLRTANTSCMPPKLDTVQVTGQVGPNSARSSYMSSTYQAWAEYAGPEKGPSTDGDTGVPDANDRDIHVKNVVTVSTHTDNDI